VVTICTTSLTFNNCTLCPHCMYVFCIYLRKNSDLFQFLHQLIGFNDIVLTPYNPDDTIWTTRLTFIICTLCSHCMYVFCIYLRNFTDLCQFLRQLIRFNDIVLTPYNSDVTICTTCLTFNNCKLCPRSMYVFSVYLRTNSDFCHLQHKLIGFYNIV